MFFVSLIFFFSLSGTILFFYVLFFAVVPTVNYSIKGLPGAYTSLMTHVSVTIALATKQRKKKKRGRKKKRKHTREKNGDTPPIPAGLCGGYAPLALPFPHVGP